MVLGFLGLTLRPAENKRMSAVDVMSRKLVTATPEMIVLDVAKLTIDQ